MITESMESMDKDIDAMAEAGETGGDTTENTPVVDSDGMVRNPSLELDKD